MLIKELELNGSMISSKSIMNVLGIIFDGTMKSTELVSKAIKVSNTVLYGIVFDSP